MNTLTDGEREIMQELNNDAALDWTADDADDTEGDQEDQANLAAVEAAVEARDMRHRVDVVVDHSDHNREPF